MKNRLKGVTLIEMMLYIGLFSVIIILVMNFMLSTQEAIRRTNIRGQVYKSSEFVIQHLEGSFEHAASIDANNSLFDSGDGVLSISFADGTKQYTLVDSVLYFAGVPITPHTISVLSFTVTPVSTTSGEIFGVKVVIKLVSTNDSEVDNDINILLTLR